MAKIGPWVWRLPLNLMLRESKVHGIDVRVIAAVAMTESSGNPFVTRYEDHYRWLVEPERFAKQNGIQLEQEKYFQKTSWGMLQIMGGVARELGYYGPLTRLAEPSAGLSWGSKKLAECLKKYGNLTDAISAYNQGSPRKDDKGEYINHVHVARFLNFYNALKSIK